MFQVINSLEKVRKWEKKLVLIKDTNIRIYKWVPGRKLEKQILEYIDF